MPAEVSIRMTTPDDWRERRTLRLEMLADTPLAFLDRIENAEGYPDSEWKSRARRAASAGNCSAVAIAPGGDWVGTMSAFVSGADAATLVTVYVTPDHRGRAAGVADRLLERVEEWARSQPGVTRMILEVHEQNPVAIAFYRRHGYAPTGATKPYPLDRSQRELVFDKSLY